MKTCTYCGKQYPDSAVVCPVDQQSLENPDDNRKDVTGSWIGSYSYPQNPGSPAVPFTLKLRQEGLGHFTGTVTEDATLGMPGIGIIEGKFVFPRIEFIKRMPVCYLTAGAGRRVTLREWLATQDLVCEGDPPHPPVSYQGRFYDISKARGMWVIEPWEIPLAGGMSMPMGGASGAWMIKCEAA